LTELEKLIRARDERHSLKKKLSESGKVLISMNLNVPGFPKSDPFLKSFFILIKEQLLGFLLANRVLLDSSNELLISDDAGDFYIVPLKNKTTDTSIIKQITEQFEGNHKLGRFIDVDVTGESGEIISSGKSKTCFYCKKFPAIVCRREEKHSIKEIRDFQREKIKAYLEKNRLKETSRKLSSMALQAIIHEITLTPKPGLIDRAGSGTHSDMDFQSFVISTSIISMSFQSLVKKGFKCKSKDLPNALTQIRQIGLEMEKDMFAQTNGVNTQKGLIFLMGLSLFASAHVIKKNKSFDSRYFQDTVRIICKDLVKSELKESTNKVKTHGELCFEQYGASGTRGEAENGLQTVFDHALPVLLNQDRIDDSSLILTLLAIMSQLDDTNILYRSNIETLNQLKEICDKVFRNYSFDKYEEIIDFCMQKKISPGGSADLLSISVFIYLLIKNYS
jgi:holo-ACP synthase / triphosphoribosyl-dephospho-CoA synthase